MPVSKSSKPRPNSKPVARSKGGASRGGAKSPPVPGSAWPVAAIAVLLVAISAAAAWFFYSHGYLLYYGDAAAHLNIARRIVDTRIYTWKLIGTVWLPLPHLLMLPFVTNDQWWRTGLAATFPMATCFVIAGTFLFAAARRILGSGLAALWWCSPSH